jgi:hypothetical protein
MHHAFLGISIGVSAPGLRGARELTGRQVDEQRVDRAQRELAHFVATCPRVACCAFTYFMMFRKVSVQ